MLNVKKIGMGICQKVGAFFHAPSSAQVQGILFLVGITLLAGGLAQSSFALNDTTYNDDGFRAIASLLLTHIEGAFGALLMIVAGIGAIFSAALGQYRAALSLLVVAIGAFILRTLVQTFFNVEIDE